MTTYRTAVWGVIASIASVTTAGAATSEDGGSGLTRVDYAWSMPVTDMIFAINSGYFSHDFTPGTDRFVRLTPSLTKGLGGGFEGAAALPFDGISQNLDREEDGFDRRVDIRRRDLLAKLRWSGSLGSPRARFGAEGGIGLPLSSSQKTRAGGTEKPGDGYDLSASGLFSADIGWFDFPVRVHLNGGYFWSRNDGAVYYQDHPLAIPIDGSAVTDNDVATAGIAIEAGLRRFVAFGELTTEQLMGARAQVRGKENLWRLTPGIRTELAPDIALTAAATFNLATDDDRTAFDPNDVYPDFEFRLGVSLGNVLSRNKYETRKRTPAADSWPIVSEVALEKAAEADSIALAATMAVPEDVGTAAAAGDAGLMSPAGATSMAGASATEAVATATTDASAAPVDTAAEAQVAATTPVEAASSAPASIDTTPPVAAVPAPVVEVEPPAVPATAAATPMIDTATASAPTSGSTPSASGGASVDDIERRLEERLARFELGVRMTLLESRMGQIERGSSPPVGSAPAWWGTPASSPTTAPSSTTSAAATTAEGSAADPMAVELKTLQEQIATLRAELSGVTERTATETAASADAAARSAAQEEESRRAIAALQSEVARMRADTDSTRATRALQDVESRMAAYEAELRALRQARSAASDDMETRRAIADLERQIATLRASPVTIVTPPAATPPAATPVVAPASPAVVVTPPATPAASRTEPTAASTEADARVEALIAQLEKARAGAPEGGRDAVPDTAPTIEPFPLRIGETASVRNDSDAAVTAFVDQWASRLRAHPSIRVSLVVHGGGADAAAALIQTDADAKRWQQMFVTAGVPSAQVVPLGMGTTEVGPRRHQTYRAGAHSVMRIAAGSVPATLRRSRAGQPRG